MRRSLSAEQLDVTLTEIATLNLADLRRHWWLLHNEQPPSAMSIRLLRYAISYKLQEMAFGKLDRNASRALAKLEDPGAKPIRLRPRPKLKPGTQLLRRWGGVTHEVTILDRGVLYRGERRRSLTAVAMLITGAHWSGPTFFGLKEISRDAA